MNNLLELMQVSINWSDPKAWIITSIIIVIIVLIGIYFKIIVEKPRP